MNVPTKHPTIAALKTMVNSAQLEWNELAAPQGFEPRYADPESASEHSYRKHGDNSCVDSKGLIQNEILMLSVAPTDRFSLNLVSSVIHSHNFPHSRAVAVLGNTQGFTRYVDFRNLAIACHSSNPCVLCPHFTRQAQMKRYPSIVLGYAFSRSDFSPGEKSHDQSPRLRNRLRIDRRRGAVQRFPRARRARLNDGRCTDDGFDAGSDLPGSELPNQLAGESCHA